MTVLPTENQKWGFWGEISNKEVNPSVAWETASMLLMDTMGLTPEQTRSVLDSRVGRWVAESLTDNLTVQELTQPGKLVGLLRDAMASHAQIISCFTLVETMPQRPGVPKVAPPAPFRR